MSTLLLSNLIFVISAGCIGLSAFGGMALLNEGKPIKKSKFFMGGMTLFFAILFAELIALGLLGFLTLPALLLCNLSLALLSTSIVLFKKISIQWTAPSEKSQSLLKNLVLLAFILCPISIIILRQFYALYQIPIEYDNLAYHLPIVVEWLQLGHMREVFYSPFAGPLGYYPSNFELLDLWVLLIWGDDLVVNQINLSLSALLGLALFFTGKSFGFKTAESIAIFVMFFSLPVVLRQIGTPQVELLFCLHFVSSLYFLNEYEKENASSDLFLFALCTGLFLGTKYLAAPYSIPLLGIVVLLAFKANLKKKAYKKILFSALIVFAGCTLGGGYWYLRNWVNAGNPLFPAEVKLSSITIFKGYYGLTERIFGLSLLENVRDWESFKTFAKTYLSMTGCMLMLIPILPIFYGTNYLTQRKQSKVNNKLLLLIIGTFLYFFLYWKSPYSFDNLIPNVRYSLMFLILGIFALAGISSQMKKARYLMLPALFLGSIANFKLFILEKYGPEANVIINEQILTHLPLEQSQKAILLLFSLTLLFTVFALYFCLKGSKKIAASLALLVFLGTTQLLNSTQTERENIRSIFYPNWEETGNPTRILWKIYEIEEWLNKNRPEANLAYAGFHSSYPLYGRSLQRKANYVNINECTNCRYVDYKDSKDSIRRDPDQTSWETNLAILNKNVLVLYLGDFYGDIYSYEQDFVKNAPNKFHLIYSIEDFSVYDIKNS